MLKTNMHRLWPLLFLFGCTCSAEEPCITLTDCESEQICLDGMCASPGDSSMPGDTTVDNGTVLLDAFVDVAADATLGPVAVEPPSPFEFPEEVGIVSVTVRIADNATAGTDSPLQLCLSPTHCFPLNNVGHNDFERSQVDVIHVPGGGMTRSDVERMTFRTGSDPLVNNDQVRINCIDVRLDGEPVYCDDGLDIRIGTGDGADEVSAYSANLNNGCDSCFGKRLTHGPMVSPPSESSVAVWARTDATRRTSLQLATVSDGSDAVAVAWADPSPENDFGTLLTAEGLAPGTTYYYRIEVDGGAQQPFRPISTTPSADTESPVSVAFGSCSQDFPQPIFSRIDDLSPDLFLFMGDTHYGNSPELDRHRFEYRQNRSDPSRSQLMAKVPTMAIWDDHDFTANNSHGACEDKASALGAFKEWWPGQPAGTAQTDGVFFRHRHGPIEFFMMDCRYHRPSIGDLGSFCANTGERLDASGGPLGRAQFDWLLSGLESSDAPFKMLACGSRWTATRGQDSWFSFPEARLELFQEFSDRNIDGVVLMSGDVHRSQVLSWEREGDYPLTELVSSPLSQYPSGTLGRSCTSERNMSFCHPFDSFIEVTATKGSEWVLEANVRDDAGEIIHTVTLPRSALE